LANVQVLAGPGDADVKLADDTVTRWPFTRVLRVAGLATGPGTNRQRRLGRPWPRSSSPCFSVSLLSSSTVAIAASIGKLMPRFKPKDWERLSQMLLDACEILQGSEEMEWEGAARMYLHDYLSETGFIPSIEDQRIQDRRRPMVLNGKTSICASDFQVYINKTTFQALSVKAIAGMLAALGATSTRLRSGRRQSFKEQSRWILPDEFNPSEYSTKHNKENVQ
jgi:hypothetical protein